MDRFIVSIGTNIANFPNGWVKCKYQEASGGSIEKSEKVARGADANNSSVPF